MTPHYDLRVLRDRVESLLREVDSLIEQVRNPPTLVELDDYEALVLWRGVPHRQCGSSTHLGEDTVSVYLKPVTEP